MKNVFPGTIFFILTIVGVGFVPYDKGTEPPSATRCDQKELTDKGKTLLDPFQYDNSRLTQIDFKNKPQKITLDIPLFFGEEYRTVFTTVDLPQNAEINIYDKPANSKKRELLFSSKNSSGTDFLFEIERSDKMIVEYDIPLVGSDSINKSACVLFMLGYR